MRALLFHAKDFKVEFDSLANRPKNIVHEEINGKEKQETKDCIVAFVTVEKGDKNNLVVKPFCHEIEKFCKDVKRESGDIAICAFV